MATPQMLMKHTLWLSGEAGGAAVKPEMTQLHEQEDETNRSKEVNR